MPTRQFRLVVDAELARAAQVVRDAYGPIIAATGGCAQPGSNTDHAQPSSPRTPPVLDGSERSLQHDARCSNVSTNHLMASSPALRLTSVLRATSPHAGNDSTGSMNDDAELDQLQTPDDPSAESAAEESEFEPGSDDGDIGVNALSSVLLADKDDNLKLIDDEGDAVKYGLMNSGDDAEKYDLEVGEDQDESTNAHASDDEEAAATDEAICAELHFAQSFLDSFGGEDQLLAGNLKSDVLCSMSAEGGEDVVEPDTHDYLMTPNESVSDTSSYPGLRHGYSGPTPDALRNAESPLTLFFFFMPVALW
ncbi:unnamed protein product [Phytophthora fragariaefolia]|uniref:Unnamed protein product n=1 Tax=Phytophthora fragariaefolia TaxID=1490495 RepID=A0A9W6XLA8_9STRA|nr:unnamed protein product [Phytophthora fragariaefolia]